MPRSALLAFVTALILTGCAPRQTEPVYRAERGGDVHIVEYRVKPGAKADFERFVVEVLKPAKEQIQPEASAKTHFWTPTARADDGFFHYVFVYDPYVETVDYQIENVLSRVYGDAQAEAYMNQFKSYVEDSTYLELQQSRW